MVFELLFQGWIPIAVLVIFISLVLISIIYMIARIFDNDTFKKWAQNEIYQVIASALVVGSLFIFLGIINNIVLLLVPFLLSTDFSCNGTTCSYTEIQILINSSFVSSKLSPTQVTKQCGEGYCHIELTRSILREYYDLLRFYLKDKVESAGWIVLFKSINIQIFGFKFSPFAGLSPISDLYSNFLGVGLNLLSLIKINEIFLFFVSSSLFPMFLIAGIALRSISIFRGVGGLMLSIAVGSFFVYPLLLLFSFSFFAPVSGTQINVIWDENSIVQFLGISQPQPQSQSQPSGQQITWISSPSAYKQSESFISDTFKFVKNLFSGFLFFEAKSPTTGQQINYDLFSYLTLTALLPGGFLDTLSLFTVWLFVPFIISIYSFVVFIKEFSSFLGGDIDIAGLSKLI